jgi:putative hemolysin
VRGYLRMGATVCGPPAWDPAFRTADVVMVLPMLQLARRFAERFRRAA